MNSLLHRDTDDEDVDDAPGRSGYAGAQGKDREITLGTTMVIGIVFALAVFAAVFFGFGYSVGAKRAVQNSSVSPDGPGAAGTFNNFKPAPGSPLGSPSAAGAANAGSPSVAHTTVPAYTPATPAATTRPAPVAVPPVANRDTPVPAPTPARPTPRASAAVTPEPSATPTPSPAVLAAGSSMVQVAAVSHQEDADLLVSTLKRRGYAVGVHSEPQDKLLHVQIGPFGSRKEADVMRQKLLADGFNAIVK